MMSLKISLGQLLLLLTASAAAFSTTQQPVLLLHGASPTERSSSIRSSAYVTPPLLGGGVTRSTSATAAARMKQQHFAYPISTSLWGRSSLHKQHDDENNGEEDVEQSSSSISMFQNLFALSHKKKALTAASLALLASAAFPVVSNAVDLNNMYGGAMTVASTTNTLLARLSETGFYQAFTLVFLSEIGDKTFFMAGLLSAKTSKFTSFLGSMGALVVMTVISVLIGQIFHAVPSGFTDGVPIDDVLACLAFAFFGITTLKDALDMEEGESVMDEELAEAEETVEESGSILQPSTVGQIASIFALVFAAEFGDRSFLSTIALSAAQNPVSVGVGAVAAHGVATGIAVSGGSYIAKYISERVLGIIGGSLFIIFAITTAVGIF